MSWIVSAVMAVIALIAVTALWRRHQREIRALRSTHAEALENLDDEHHRRVKRLSREHEQHLLTAHHPLANDLLPALDSLDRALEQISSGEPQSLQDFKEGIELARKGLTTAMGRHGIRAIIPARGDDFDPRVHEAISRIESDEGEAGTVAALLRAGYCHDARVLRPAMVTVFASPPSISAGDEEAFDDAKESQTEESPIEENASTGEEPREDPLP